MNHSRTPARSYLEVSEPQRVVVAGSSHQCGIALAGTAAGPAGTVNAAHRLGTRLDPQR